MAAEGSFHALTSALQLHAVRWEDNWFIGELQLCYKPRTNSPKRYAIESNTKSRKERETHTHTDRETQRER